MEMLPGSPDPWNRGDMKHGVDARDCSFHVGGISNIPMENVDAACAQLGVITACQHTHPMASHLKLLDDVASEKPTTAGDQSRECLHDDGGR